MAENTRFYTKECDFILQNCSEKHVFWQEKSQAKILNFAYFLKQKWWKKYVFSLQIKLVSEWSVESNRPTKNLGPWELWSWKFFPESRFFYSSQNSSQIISKSSNDAFSNTTNTYKWSVCLNQQFWAFWKMCPEV